MKKKIKIKLKLTLIGGKAVSNATLGRILGQSGINIPAFCKDYNSKTMEFIGILIPINLIIYTDKSYVFTLKSPPTSYLLLKYAEIKKGSLDPKTKTVGYITQTNLKEIIELKKNELNTTNFEKLTKIISGTAKSMGITIKSE